VRRYSLCEVRGYLLLSIAAMTAWRREAAAAHAPNQPRVVIELSRPSGARRERAGPAYCVSRGGLRWRRRDAEELVPRSASQWCVTPPPHHHVASPAQAATILQPLGTLPPRI